MRREKDIHHKRNLSNSLRDLMYSPRARVSKIDNRISCQNSSPSEIKAASRLIVVHRAKLIILLRLVVSHGSRRTFGFFIHKKPGKVSLVREFDSADPLHYSVLSFRNESIAGGGHSGSAWDS